MNNKLMFDIFGNALICLAASMIGGFIVARTIRKSKKRDEENLTYINHKLRTELFKSWEETELLKKRMGKEA